jgi:hypothetical protein
MTNMTNRKITAAVAIGVLAGVVIGQHAAADIPVSCNGDATACGLLNVVQYGTDFQSGVHFVMKFSTEPGRPPQSMMLTLSIASSKDSCDSATDTFANVNPDESRSIDGYLCQLRATWERN